MVATVICMPRLSWVLSVCLCLLVFASSSLVRAQDSLSGSSTTLGQTGVNTTGTSFSTAMSLSASMPDPGSMLVIATFSAKTASGANERTGEWRLTTGGSSSLSIRRYLSGVSDSGVAAIAHVFSGLGAGSQTVLLEHLTDTGGRNIKTYFATLVTIPLVTDGGAILNHGLSQLAGAFTTTSTSLVEVTGSQSTVTLDQPGRILMVATFNSATGGGTATTGSWDMQIHNGTSWVTVGTVTQRYLSGSGDEGAVMLIGRSEELPANTYSFRLRSASNTGESLQTYNATVAAVALSYDEDGGGYFPVGQDSVAAATTSSANLDPITGIDIPFTLSDGADVFLGLSFASETNSGAGNTDAFFDVAIDAVPGVQIYEGQKVERDLSGNDDLGAGGVVGLTTLAATGNYNAYAEHAITGGNVLGAIQPNLVALVLDSVSTGASPTIDKNTLTSTVQAGNQATYTIVIGNTGATTATGVTVQDVLPLSGGESFTYASTPTIMTTGSPTRTSVLDPTIGDTAPEWGTWDLPQNSSLTITFVVDVPAAMPLGTYDNTASVDGTNFAEIDDDGDQAQDAGTPAGADPEDDEDVEVQAAGGAGGTGDVDGDGDVDLADARLVLQIAEGILSPTQDEFDAADIDGDGDVDATDVALISACVSCGCGP